MFSRLTHLTEDVFQIGLMDSFMRSTALLSAKEFSLLEEVLEVFPSLAVSEQTDRWYNG
jgi:hypothetical protein